MQAGHSGGAELEEVEKGEMGEGEMATTTVGDRIRRGQRWESQNGVRGGRNGRGKSGRNRLRKVK